MGVLRLERNAPDRARPVGAAPTVLDASARHSYFDPLGELVFGGEVPVWILPNKRRQVEFEDGDALILGRFEVKAKKAAAAALGTESPPGPPRSSEQLVVTEWPYANRWVTHAHFKPGPPHRSKEGRIRFPPGTPDEVSRALGDLRYDPWETRKSWLTATLPMAASGKARSLPKPVWLLGTCSDFDVCVKYLTSHPRAVKLLKDIKRRRLRTGFKVEKGRRQANVRTPKPAAIDAADELITLAAGQALAGPNEPCELVGEPVITLVEWIFRGHVDNETREAMRREKRRRESGV